MNRVLVVLLFCLFSTMCYGQQQVTSFFGKEGDKGSNPKHFTSFNGKYIFQANTDEFGNELWITDGTAANTSLLRDINEGSDNAIVTSLKETVTQSEDLLYFIANDGIHGNQIWQTDGTSSGTVLTAEMIGFNTGSITALDGKIFFLNKTATELELWALTIETNVFEKLSNSLGTNTFTNYQGAHLGFFFFTIGTQGNNKVELFRFDDTNTNLRRLNGRYETAGLSNGDFSSYSEANGFLFFTDHISFDAPRILKTDGNTISTQGILDDRFGADAAFTISHNEKAYFYFYTSPDHDIHIYSTDGTGSGLNKILVGTGNIGSNLLVVQNQLLYVTRNNSGTINLNAINLDTDGATNLTTLNHVVSPRFFQLDLTVNLVRNKEDEVLISFNDENREAVSYTYSLTTNTLTPKEIGFHPEIIPTSFGLLYSGGPRNETEPWMADPSVDNLQMVKNIGQAKYGLSLDTDYIALGDQLIFTAETGNGSHETFGYSTQTNEIQLLVDTGDDPNVAFLLEGFHFNNELWMAIWGFSEVGLYKTNATTEGTQLVQSFSNNRTRPYRPTIFQDELYALVNGHFSKFNGSSFDLLLDMRNHPIQVLPILRMAATDELIFIDRVNDLWISDGTVSGTSSLKDFDKLREFTTINNRLFFIGEDPATEQTELWVSDGTTNGTLLVKDMNDSQSGNPSSLTIFQDKLVFSVQNLDSGRELWITDGTEAGTTLIKDILPGAGSAIMQDEIAVLGNYVYFAANNGESGTELWKTDGTDAGTNLVFDLNEGSGSSSPAHFLVVDDELYFSAYHNDYGRELWHFNSTTQEIQIVFDLNEGTTSSLPVPIMLQEGRLVFLAYTNETGYQIWRDGDAPTFELSGDLVLDEDFEGPEVVQSTNTSDQTITDFSITPESIDFAELTFDNNTGMATFTALANTHGSQEFTVIANDGTGADPTYTQFFTLTIVPVNDAPTIETIGIQNVIAGEQRSVQISTFDIDMDELDGILNVTNEAVLSALEWTLTKENNSLFTLNLVPQIEATGGSTLVNFILSDGSIETTLEFEIIVSPADITGIEDERFSNEIAVYPNITDQLVTLEFTMPPLGTELYLIGSDMKPVQQVTLDGKLIQQIDLSLLPSGMYLIRLKDKRNRLAVKKVLKR